MAEVDKKYIIALLRKLSDEEVLEIAQECIELLGISEVKEYAQIRMEKIRTVYDKLNKNKLPCLKIDNLKLPCININLNQ